MIYKLLFILIFISSFHGFAQEDQVVKIVDTLKQDHETFTNAAKKVNFANPNPMTQTTYMDVETKMNSLNMELKNLNSSKVTPEKVSRLYNHLNNLQHKINKDMNTPEMEDFVKKYNSHITHLKTQLAPHTPHTAAVIDMLNYHEKGLETANGRVHTAENLRTMVGNTNLSPNDHPVNKKALKETSEKYAKLNRYMKKVMDQKAQGKLTMTEPELRKLHKKLESFKIDVTKQDPVGQKKWELYRNINKLKAQGKDTIALEKELTKLENKPHVRSNIVALSEHHNAHIENLQKHLQQPHPL